MEPDPQQDDEPKTRGKGRGSRFFALGRPVLEQLYKVPTANRLNFVLTYLVLLAGTGSDHRLTKWSAKACEEHLGVGKPRAKQAIDELIACGLVKRSDASTPLRPQYELGVLPLDGDEPIFLPVQIVTGFGKGDSPVLRRVRETGDAMLLRMLLDLYGMISLDPTHGIPIRNLRGGSHEGAEPTARKHAEIGAHGIWSFTAGGFQHCEGQWAVRHCIDVKGSKKPDWSPFWERLAVLKKIGAVYAEPWIFESAALDAEPIMPLDTSGFYAVVDKSDEAKLTRHAFDVCRALAGEERAYIFELGGEYFMPLTLHRQTPMLRFVTRPRVEADTPGSRLAYGRRKRLIEQLHAGLDQLQENARAGNFSRPMQMAGGASV